MVILINKENIFFVTSPPAFSYSQLTIETVEQDVIFSKLTIKIPEHENLFIVNFEHISHPVLLFLLLTLNLQSRAGLFVTVPIL